MKIELRLPAHTGNETPELPQGTRQVTLVGANGAGKSRFMEELIRLCDSRAYCLSALSAGFPEREVSAMPGSIDDLYRRRVRSQPYMRTDAVSEIDKLTYMLFIDEFEYLMSLKRELGPGADHVALKPTRLDRLTRLWESLFPGNRIVRDAGRLLFATGSGSDLIPISRLSQGEQTVLYHIAGALYAPENAVIFIDAPSLFVHPSILNSLWNSIEQLRPDCLFVYDSVDEDFVATRTENACIWIRNYDSAARAWDYRILQPGQFSEDLFFDLIGSRKPVLFIEGDSSHSIDVRLYTLVFPECTVRPLGSCNKVIETTRSFNDLKYLHHLDSRGIVDRDRRTDAEVDYLQRKNILVPDVAEVENLFLLEEVVKIMARHRAKDAEKVFNKVKTYVVRLFARMADQQALLHVRHKVKREVECKIDARFTCITAMETHLASLVNKLKPRENFQRISREFHAMAATADYAAILRVFNHKPMLGDCGIDHLLGYSSKEAYVNGVIALLKDGGNDARILRASLRHSFGVDTDLLPAMTAAAVQATAPSGGTAAAPQKHYGARRHDSDLYNPADKKSRKKKRSRSDSDDARSRRKKRRAQRRRDAF